MLITRIISALIFAPALLYIIILGGLPLTITVAILALLMQWEVLQLTLGKKDWLLKITGYLSGALIVANSLGIWKAVDAALLWSIIMIVGLLVVLANPGQIEKATSRVSFMLFSVAYGAALIPYLSLLRELKDGMGYALMALFCTWGADTMAYFAGRAFGKHKLYPKISPKKTIEGALGGILGAIAMVFFLRWLFNIELAALHLVAIAIVASVMGMVGDLAESLLKRSVGAKDSSSLIPGHGGVLDRFDAVMFAAPAVYFYILLFVQRVP
ncbi:phosphatidate cytidylyltransferase [Myxococcota bacterium]|nr:phosphatidate cytidylyltransferase [Myxococcota bacterium]